MKHLLYAPAGESDLNLFQMFLLVPFAIFLMFWNSSCSFISDTWPGGLWAFLNGRQWFLRKWGVWAPTNFLSLKSLANTSTIYKIVYIKNLHVLTFCIFFLSPIDFFYIPKKSCQYFIDIIYKIVYIKNLHVITFCIFFLSPNRLLLHPRKVLPILQRYNI